MATARVMADMAVKAVNFTVHMLRSATSLPTRTAGQLWARRASLKHWHVWGALVAILALAFTILAFWITLDANRYARWTAQKDFMLICADEVRCSYIALLNPHRFLILIEPLTVNTPA
ncbi:hypothetical protein CONLIGDRAFT_503352 [Coniochaeta ligniaria NRRL 30616]|uniref:Uncharacterized protein n=1 Tax=Coniochaeta ligniaria NRRL 30616 TaxID=1408157 RepID=A0A1J7IEA7_9PEZI|nr:hypothetical protein CONLIGDRAFT_503352 [Coniochaeta ligniaria NRRL 30616]